MKISVIIPVYNVGNYIEKSIQSLLNQTLSDIEFIFIDDKSTDNSLEIIQKYTDNRIKILCNEKNSGAGFSRNQGIKAATGEYLAFFDPDDSVDLDFYEKLYNKAKEGNFDIVKGERITLKNNETCYSDLNKNIEKALKENKPLYLSFAYEHQSAIFKHELIEKYNIEYGLSRRSQDVTLLLKVCYFAKTFTLLNGTFYYYNIRFGSSTQNRNKNYYSDNIFAIKERLEFLNEIKNSINEKNYIECICSNLYYALYMFNLLYDNKKLKNKRKEIFKQIYQTSLIIENKEAVFNSVNKDLKLILKNKYYSYIFRKFIKSLKNKLRKNNVK